MFHMFMYMFTFYHFLYFIILYLSHTYRFVVNLLQKYYQICKLYTTEKTKSSVDEMFFLFGFLPDKFRQDLLFAI